ncbi:squalene/phytoene synthase family protein [Acidocella sp.]|uniref:squalene/phytoene synthase family protein n=1 Tax=Acidocella sp. TaxID=50710 RepID=UPI00262437DD|nr:squalene/phytoene synthase family protein [Acidocella sp.]
MIGLRAKDPDRYFAALFAPPPLRAPLALLYLFNHELARAIEAASAPPLALIRLHWWRELVAGAAHEHELTGPLTTALAAGTLPRAALLALIEAREPQAEGLEPAELPAFARATGGALARIAGGVLGADNQAIEDLGTAQALTGLVRNAAYRRARKAEPRAEDQAPPEILLAQARALLTVRPPKGTTAAWLGAALAARDLARLQAGQTCPARRGAGDYLAALLAAIKGRV